MITQKQIDNLKSGNQLIFYCWGGVLSANKGNVFTFANWYEEDDEFDKGKYYWQCQELLDQGNYKHNFCIHHTELFNESIHKEFKIMDENKINHQQQEFINKYGG